MFIFDWLYEYIMTPKYDMTIAIAARGYFSLFIICLIITAICALITSIIIHFKK